MSAKDRTVSIIRSLKMMGTKLVRRAIPRQQVPIVIERAYGKALGALVSKDKVRAAFEPLLRELPALVASAKTGRGDRLDANEGKRARELIAQAKQRLAGSINTHAIEALAEKYAEQISTHQRIQLGRQVRAALGHDIFTGDKGLTTRFSNFASENVSLITGDISQIATKVEKTVTSGLASGKLHADLANELEEHFGFGESRSKLIARDQVGKLYGQLNASRQKDLGVTRFIWRTVGDDRVRDEHDDFETESESEPYSYDDPPVDDSGEAVLPGEPICCRCYAEPVFEDILDR